MKKQSILHRWISFVMVFVLVCGMIVSPMKIYANPYSGGNSNCTATAWRLAYENTGISLPAWSNAVTWYDSARNAGFVVSTVPRERSIAVWKGGPNGYGHVAYVSTVNGNEIYIKEGGYSGGYHEGWENAYDKSKNYGSNGLTMIGYIYLGDSKVNLGDSFYAFITNAYCGLDATAIDGDIKLKTEIGTGNQVFQFTKTSDGYYQILECKNRQSMDVTNASNEHRANVGTFTPNNTSAQKWYITGNGPYTIHAACTSRVLSTAWGGTSDGTSINMENDGQGNWQKWYIRKLPAATSSTLNVQVGQGKATFNWQQSTNSTSYSLRILKNNQYCHSEYGLKVLSKTVELEPGTYTAYIDSCNEYSYTKSNEVTFTITQKAPTIPNIKAPILTSVEKKTYGTLQIKWKGVSNATHYILERREGTNGKWIQLKTFKKDVRTAQSRSLKTGTRYYYRIRARRTINNNNKIYSPYSDIKSNIPTMKTTKVSIKKNTSSSAQLSWKTVSGANGYEIYRAVGNGKYEKIKTVSSKTKSLIIKSLKKSKTYKFKVRAYRKISNKKVYNNYSNAVSYKS